MRVTGSLSFVFLDVGGVMYDDGVYRQALLRALRELGAEVSEADFAAEYEACRNAQAGSFRERLTRRFLGRDADVGLVEVTAAPYWTYPSGSLEPDVFPCLEALSGRFRLGVIANQLSGVRASMRRDGIERFFEVWAVSEDLGVQKPDRRIFVRALELASVEPSRVAMVGDRLDYDIIPAGATGLQTVWVLRGEAPDDPTTEQLAVADAVIRSLSELPAALERL